MTFFNNQKISIRLLLMLLITSLLLATSLVTFFIYAKSGGENMLFLGQNIASEVSKDISERMTRRVETMTNVVFFAKDAITYRYNPKTKDKINVYLKSILAKYPEFDEISFCSATGEGWLSKRMWDGSISTRYDTFTNGEPIKYWTHSGNEIYKTYPSVVRGEQAKYDCRKTAWYKRAVIEEKEGWSELFTFDTDKIPGRAYSAPILDKNKNITGVISLSVNILGSSFFLNTLKIAETGQPYIISKDGKLFSAPLKDFTESQRLIKKNVTPDGDYYFSLRTIEESDFSALKTAYIHWQKNNYKDDEFTYFVENERLFVAYFSKYSEENDSTPRYISIILQESEVTREIHKNNMQALTAAVIIIALAVFAGLKISKKIVTPIKNITQELKMIRSLDLDKSSLPDSDIAEFAEINKAVADMKQNLRAFRKYVPQALANQLMSLSKDAVIETERREITVMFSDIENFTATSEVSDINILTNYLSVYFEKMTKILVSNHATIDKYIGDSIMSFWNAPTLNNRHAELACKAALECQKFLSSFSTTTGNISFTTRMAINTGESMVGNVGFSERMNYTVLGDNVNTASRLEKICKVYGTKIIISSDVLKSIGDKFITRYLDKIYVRGRMKHIDIHELIAENGQESELDRQIKFEYEKGLNLYFSREWDKAIERFEKVLSIKPTDKASALLIARIQVFKVTPPPEYWNGASKI